MEGPALAEQVALTKSAWRKHAASLTWEEKVAAIERMWARDAVLRREREVAQASRRSQSAAE